MQEHLFDPRSGEGFITDRCKTIQRNLAPELRRYTKRIKFNKEEG
jgi:hypothetical protein